jgi:hypothetical protein
VLKVPSGPQWQQIMQRAARDGWVEISPSVWQQIQVDGRPGGPQAPPGSRRWRRRMPDYLWRKSEK